jgi:uncharacterized protein YceK
VQLRNITWAFTAAALLAGCGMAATTTTQAEAAAEAAQEAEKVKQKLQNDLAAAQQKAGQTLAEAEQ